MKNRSQRPGDSSPANPLVRLVEDPTKEKVDYVLNRLDTKGVSRAEFLKLLGISTAAVAAAPVLAACGSSGGGAKTTAAAASASGSAAVVHGKIAMLSWAQGNEYPVQWAKGHVGACDQLGLSSVVLDGQFDAGRQMTQFQEQLASHAAGIVIGANDPGAIPVMAKDCNEAKILFSNAWNLQPWYTPWDSGDYYDRFLLPDDAIAVEKTIDLLAKAVNEEGTVIRVGGVQGSTAENLSVHGAKNGLKKYPKMKLVDQLYGLFQADKSQQVTARLLSKHPDTVAVLAADDDGALGVVAAIKAAGKTPGKDIFVVGADATSGGVKLIKSGEMLATTGSTPSYPGYVTVVSFYDRFNGWKPDMAERTYGWHSTIITSANVAKYEARYTSQPESKHFSAVLMSRVKTPKDWDLQYDAYPIEDLATIWPLNPMPANYKYPPLYMQAKNSGGFDRILKLYQEHYKVQVLDPSPMQ
jgi:ribose transport system substrate-binding protein